MQVLRVGHIMRRNWSYWLTVLAAILVVIVVPTIAILWVLFPDDAAHFFENFAQEGRLFVWLQDPKLLKMLGALSTLIPGAFTLYRLWYFAERQLPDRLKDYIEKCGHAAAGDRAALLEVLDARWRPIMEASATSAGRLDERQRKKLVTAHPQPTPFMPQPCR